MLSNQYYFSKILFYNSIIKIFKKKNKLFIIGPLGFLFLILSPNIMVKQFTNGIQFFSLYSQQKIVLTNFYLLKQKIYGVTFGFFEVLIIKGIGWKISINGRNLTFSLGFSHVIRYTLSSNIEIISLDTKQQSFKIFGLDLVLLQDITSQLCSLRLFDIYKGTGIFKKNSLYKLKISSKSKS